MYAACQAIGPKVGVGAESLRRWVLQAQVDAAQRPGATTAEQWPRTTGHNSETLPLENRERPFAVSTASASPSWFFVRAPD